jgi:hypothetical protein
MKVLDYHYPTLPVYLVEIPGFEPGAIKGTDLQSAAVADAARSPNNFNKTYS